MNRSARVNEAAVQGALTGLPVLRPGYRRYHDSISTWGGRVRSRACAVVRPSSVRDVAATVRVIRDRGLDVAVRGAGHHVAGSAVNTDGVVVDMREMRSIYPTEAGVLRVEAGTTWHDVALAAGRLGGAVPAGNAPSTGVVGVALGGGIGLFTRAWGLTCDRIRGLGVIDPVGMYRRIDADHDPELLRLARGAGRGLGIVVDLDLELVPTPTNLPTVQVHYPFAQAPEVVGEWLSATAAAGSSVSPSLTVRKFPDTDACPPVLRSQMVVSVGAVFSGRAERHENALSPLAKLGTVLHDDSGVASIIEKPAPWRPIHRATSCGHFFPSLDGTGIDTLLSLFADCPEGASMTLRALGGAILDLDENASAFAHREASLLVVAQVEWTDPLCDVQADQWCTRAEDAFTALGSRGIYGNFTAASSTFEENRAKAYGPPARIDEALQGFDPDGVFKRMSVRP